MARITLQEAIDFILKQAPHVLKEEKHHAPIIFVFGEHENAVSLFDFKDIDSKDAAMLAIGQKLAYLEPYCVVFVSEGWMSRTMPPEGKHVSEMPDKEEVLQVVVQNREGEAKAVAIPFSRIGKEILFGEGIESSEVESYLLELFWRGVRQAKYKG
jgi:hypothetical protein